jgi:hypothetical protein
MTRRGILPTSPFMQDLPETWSHPYTSLRGPDILARQRHARMLHSWEAIQTMKPHSTPENREAPDGHAGAAATGFGVGAASALERLKKLEHEERSISPQDQGEAGSDKPE